MSQNKDIDIKSFSNRLVTLVQVVFAVVIGGGLIQFHEFLLPPKFTIASFALIGVYVTSITSWAGYHHRMEQYPYTHTKLGIGRLNVDIFIVVMYAFLLFASTRQGQSIEPYLWGFSIVFLLYVGSGWLRRREYSDPGASDLKLLIKFFGFYLLVPLLFRILTQYADVSSIFLGNIFVWFPVSAMLIFRGCHDWIGLRWRFKDDANYNNRS